MRVHVLWHAGLEGAERHPKHAGTDGSTAGRAHVVRVASGASHGYPGHRVRPPLGHGNPSSTHHPAYRGAPAVPHLPPPHAAVLEVTEAMIGSGKTHGTDVGFVDTEAAM